VVHQVLERATAVSRGILDLNADFAERPAFPRHLTRCEMKLRVAGHAPGLEIGRLMADGTAHGLEPTTVRPALDGRLVHPAQLTLVRAVAGRVAVDAAWMGENLAEFGKQRNRSASGSAIDAKLSGAASVVGVVWDKA
jgi:hypothetical protein